MSDFTKEDNGRYKPNPNRKKVIATLSEDGKHFQSIRHLRENTGLSVDDLTQIIEGDEEINYSLIGLVTVYYLASTKIKGRLYNTGNNSFAIVPGTEQEDSKDKPNRIPRPSARSKLDLKLLEQFGREGKTVKEIADILDIPRSSATFYIYSKIYKQYGEAYQRGKQERRNNYEQSTNA